MKINESNTKEFKSTANYLDNISKKAKEYAFSTALSKIAPLSQSEYLRSVTAFLSNGLKGKETIAVTKVSTVLSNVLTKVDPKAASILFANIWNVMDILAKSKKIKLNPEIEMSKIANVLAYMDQNLFLKMGLI